MVRQQCALFNTNQIFVQRKRKLLIYSIEKAGLDTVEKFVVYFGTETYILLVNSDICCNGMTYTFIMARKLTYHLFNMVRYFPSSLFMLFVNSNNTQKHHLSFF